jgi:predicted helicase
MGDSFSLDDFFEVKSSGIQTKNDSVAVCWSTQARDKVISDFENLDIQRLEEIYPPQAVWKTSEAKKDIVGGFFKRRTILYKPFDIRHTVLTQRSGGFLGRPRYDVMQHIAEGDISLIVNKKHVGDYFSHVFVSEHIAIHGVNYLGNRGQDYVCPIYLAQDDLDAERRVNYHPQLWARLKEIVTDDDHGVPDEIDTFDYIYGALHSPEYRARYAETLRIGFPSVPWPKSAELFWDVSGKGRRLRELHLMRGKSVGEAHFPFCGEGAAMVEKHKFLAGSVWINKTQRFENVSKEAWEFYIGGYQPAQKWLKDRKGRELSFDDILHYQKIIKVLSETDRIMRTIELNFDD